MNGKTDQSRGEGGNLRKPPNLLDLALLFLKIGAIGFGGGMAMIALIESECVRKKGYIAPEQFLHGIGLSQFLGAFVVNTAVFVGYRMRGMAGGLTAAVTIMLPPMVMVIALSWIYFTFHEIPALQGTLAGLAPVVIALILVTVWTIGHKALLSPLPISIAILSCMFSLLHVSPVWIMLSAGLLGIAVKSLVKRRSRPGNPFRVIVPMAQVVGPKLPTITHSPSLMIPIGLSAIGWVFFKMGCVFFGGGYALIPVLYQNLVTDLGWLTAPEFMSGVAISQLTPGPVAVLATFAGYRAGGILGAIVATIALFIPSVILMLFLSRSYERLRTISLVQDFLSGITPAIAGLVVMVIIMLGKGYMTLQHPAGIVLGIIALYLLARRNWHPGLVLLLGAVVGTAFPGWFS